MAWKYTGGSSTGIDSIGAGIKVAQSQKEQNRVSTEKNKEAIKANNLKDIAKQGTQWAKITGAGDPSSDTKWSKKQNDYFSGLIGDYSNITEMMNRGEKVDEGALALSQIDKKLDDYVKFVQLSNGLKDRVIEAGEFEKGSVGAIVSDGTINDVPATLMIRDLWENPEGMKLQDDEYGNLILSRGDQRINIVEFNDSLEDGRDLLATIQDPSDLQTTAMTGILDSLDNKGKITSSYSGDGFSSKKSYYNMPSIESAFRTKNPFKSLTTNPETAAGYWELLGNEINGGEAWIGTEEQKQRFTEAWNKRTIDKLIPQDQRSSAMKATVTSYTKEEEKGEKGDAGDDLDFDGVNYNELIDINNKVVNLVEPTPPGVPITPQEIVDSYALNKKYKADKEKYEAVIEKAPKQTEAWLKKNLNLKELDGIPMSGFTVEYVDEENPNKGMKFVPRFDKEIEVPLGRNPDTGKFTLEPGDEGYENSEKSDDKKAVGVMGQGRAEFNEGFVIGNDLKTFVNYLKKETAKVTGSDDPLGII
tara:strand:- start:10467 stop:12059 length:1593 start_codon:yes stop_codon:yes gene_type:complete